MKVVFWGFRGSMGVAGKGFERYGGGTSCIEVLTNSGQSIILDAGSGICTFYKDFISRVDQSKPPVILLSHYHRDHTEGLAFFRPMYDETKKLKIFGPLLHGAHKLEDLLSPLFDGVQFPIKWYQMPSHDLRGFKAGASFKIGDALVETMETTHPGGCVAYRIRADGATFVYTGDHEIDMDLDPKNDCVAYFVSGADIAVVDSTYTQKEHETHQGWGHSDTTQWIKTLKEVGHLVLFHHDISHDDKFLDSMLKMVSEQFDGTMTKVYLAAQGLVLNKLGVLESIDAIAEIKQEKILTQKHMDKEPDNKEGKSTMTPEQSLHECPICAFFQKISANSDTHAVLGSVLAKAREFCGADAGTIYLEKDAELVFASAQNDTLFPRSKANKFFYLNASIPINDSSIAGYVATTGKPLNISDVYKVSDMPFYFNRSFDQHSGYRTKSVLAIPLINAHKKIVGVLQLINASKDGKIISFSNEMKDLIVRLGAMATVPLERALMVEESVMRMLQTSALRDPKETAGHVWRVGSMAAELYQSWAEKHDIEPDEMLTKKGQLRLAAMLHDVGKVAIPDAILKKPGKLTDEERAIMQEHAYMGAGLFKDGYSEIDKMAYDIALHHHAKWDGSGYTGTPDIKSPSGKDIPLYARITSIVDVYDALVSRRAYKDAWDPSDAIAVLKRDSGSHFDPELVDLFTTIQPVVQAIFERYAE